MIQSWPVSTVNFIIWYTICLSFTQRYASTWKTGENLSISNIFENNVYFHFIVLTFNLNKTIINIETNCLYLDHLGFLLLINLFTKKLIEILSHYFKNLTFRGDPLKIYFLRLCSL